MSRQARIIPENRLALGLDGEPDLNKWNALRLGVNQYPRNNLVNQVGANTGSLGYCHRLIRIGAPRLAADINISSLKLPLPILSSGNLLVYLVRRFLHTIGPEGLDCLNGLQLTSPFRVLSDTEVSYHPSFRVHSALSSPLFLSRVISLA